ncbi:hypothetical protein GCM10008098_16610 [Rhodanobacter panaciterrae]|uniref:Uncharacterized protein n=1 Tax=Rhodanobacter panaciterrae TaxID=490572 RepID=A0ABQ2ZS46_9GAMM|nr:hypothetical protein [Rhodanobacter panaciterrae]GGY23753.1 hypothetical protein GCM10008098_16610 [Rhodanobacter panaciterrae]
MIILYLGLLIGGVGLLLLSYVAQFRLAALLRKRYPQHWQVIAEPEHGKTSTFRTWIRMQHVLRSPALPALGDVTINRWLQVWRYSPWLGWLCWFAALAMRLLLH